MVPERASVQLVMRLVCSLGDERLKHKGTQGTGLSWIFIYLNGILSIFFLVSFIIFVTKELNILFWSVFLQVDLDPERPPRPEVKITGPQENEDNEQSKDYAVVA